MSPAAVLLLNPDAEWRAVTVYLPSTVKPTSLVLHSELVNDWSSNYLTCGRAGGIKVARPVEQVIRLPDLYVTPYHLQ